MIRARADNKNYTFHWRIQGGARDAYPLGVQILSFSCSFRQKKWINNRLVHPLRELPPPPSGKSWVRHCFYLYTVSYYTGNITTKTEVPNQPETTLLEIGYQLIFSIQNSLTLVFSHKIER